MANIQAVGELKQQCQQVQPQTEETKAAFTDVVLISFRMPQEKYPIYQHLALEEFLHLVVEVDNYILCEICPRHLLKNAMETSTSDYFFPMPAPLLRQLRPDFKYEKLYTFTERLENWRLLYKQRVNGKLDIYYRHGKSDKFFRSMVEVVNFIMYEIYPCHLVKIARGKPMAEPSKTESKKRSG
ncbi:uncharacterized protein LOC123208459 [Mangifera indica]|uniref:uncharacterized protein LOC123208459 n=1 Tax=Mangifera indica TaxID=29780 RepID=UPI001CFAD61E|nr:uncharacterized protein LOC123208459 [Mangifera indica]